MGFAVIGLFYCVGMLWEVVRNSVEGRLSEEGRGKARSSNEERPEVRTREKDKREAEEIVAKADRWYRKYHEERNKSPGKLPYVTEFGAKCHEERNYKGLEKARRIYECNVYNICAPE